MNSPLENTTLEVNIDGLIGPTHHYGGLAWGNKASERAVNTTSNPRLAALQGLEKMKLLLDLGVPQALCPPQERPQASVLRSLGFRGSHHQMIQACLTCDPRLLAALSSSSNMWMANAASVSAPADCQDGKLHITIANLSTHLHRSLEAADHLRWFRTMFRDVPDVCVHEPLHASLFFADEGAANQMRLGRSWDEKGCQIFVHGRSAWEHKVENSSTYPARQSLEANQALARNHQLFEECAIFAGQHPHAIDQGVFHNDVIATNHFNLLMVHEQAFQDFPLLLKHILHGFHPLGLQRYNRDNYKPQEICLLEIQEKEISLKRTVKSYLFNSQIVSLTPQEWCLIAPNECQESAKVATWLTQLLERETPIKQVKFVNLRQSMMNGGGPACLRLRVPLNSLQRKALPKTFWLNKSLYVKLVAWVNKHYRDRLQLRDFADKSLLLETQQALEELTQILALGAWYEFQSRV